MCVLSPQHPLVARICQYYNGYTHTTKEEKLVKMFLTLLDFSNRFTVSILRMFW